MNNSVKNSVDVLITLVVILAMVVVPCGIATGKADQSLMYWTTAVKAELLGWILAVSLFSIVLKKYKVINKVPVLIGTLVLYLAYGVGLSQFIAVAYFVVSAVTLGRLFLYLFFKSERPLGLFLQSLSIGLACYLFLFGLLIHFQVNHLGFYILVLSVPLLIAVAMQLPRFYQPQFQAHWRQTLEQLESIAYWKLVIGLAVIGYIAHFTFFPTVDFDDNATHLRMWMLLANKHAYDFDVRAQIWNVAPFAVDLLHGIVSVLAQADARGAMQLFLFSALLYGMWQLTSLLNRRLEERLLIIVLFVSTPMLAGLLVTFQAELFLAVLVTLGTVLILEKKSTLRFANIVGILMIVAMCCATKLPGAILGMALIGMFLWQSWSRPNKGLSKRLSKRPTGISPIPVTAMKGFILALFIAGFIAVHSYVYAWYVTGNPLFPLYNAIFKSPFYPNENFFNARYAMGASFKSYWGFFFNTGAYQESRNFVAGFQYLFLLPLSALLVLYWRRKRSASKLIVPLVVFGGVMFVSMQYWRYLFPILPLGSVLLGTLLLRTRNGTRSSMRGQVVKVAFILFTTLNLYFLPGIVGYFNVPASAVYSDEGRRKLTGKEMPEQHFNEYLNHFYPTGKVLYESARPFGATLVESPAYVVWYAPARLEKVQKIRTKNDLAQFLRDEKISHVYWEGSAPIDNNDLYRTLLREHLARFGKPLLKEGTVTMYRLQEQEINYQQVVQIDNFRAFRQQAELVGDRVDQAGAIIVGETPLRLIEFDTGKRSTARYSARLSCPVKTASFVAQINWEVGSYSRPVACNQDVVEFSEAIPINEGSAKAAVYLTSQNGPVLVHEVKVEVD